MKPESILSLSTLSPILPERVWALRRRLAIVGTLPGAGRPLLELATIHYARWCVIPTLPHPDGSGRPWPLNWHYLLFDATYDGPEDEYLDTFANVLAMRIAAVFGNCFGFGASVEAAPGVGSRSFPPYAFRRFVSMNKLRRLGFHAHRCDSAKTVRQAFAIERSETRGDRLSGAPLERLQSEIESLAIGPPSGQPGLVEAVVVPWMRRARPSHSVNPLTIAAPLAPGGKAAEVELDGLPDTLFARLLLVPATMQEHLGHQDPDRLPTDYVLLSSDYYGGASEYVEAVRRQVDVADAVFGQCAGFPGTRQRFEFRDWIARHTLKTQYYFAGYPPRPVRDINRLLKTRREIARWSLTRAGGAGD